MFAVTTLLALHVADAGEMDFKELVPPDQAEFPAMADDELSSGDDRRRVWDAWSLFRGVDDDMNDEELEDLMDTMSAADLDALFANGGERAMDDDYDFSRAIYDDWRVRGVEDDMNDEELEDLMDTMSAADLDELFANGGERAMDDDYDFMARSLDFGEHMGLARGVDDGDELPREARGGGYTYCRWVSYEWANCRGNQPITIPGHGTIYGDFTCPGVGNSPIRIGNWYQPTIQYTNNMCKHFSVTRNRKFTWKCGGSTERDRVSGANVIAASRKGHRIFWQGWSCGGGNGR